MLDIQAQLHLTQGQSEQALATWEQAAASYTQTNNLDGSIRNQINQAQALQELGLYRRSVALLTDLTQTLPAQSNLAMQAIAIEFPPPTHKKLR